MFYLFEVMGNGGEVFEKTLESLTELRDRTKGWVAAMGNKRGGRTWMRYKDADNKDWVIYQAAAGN